MNMKKNLKNHFRY